MADHHSPHPQRLDRPKGGRWQASRGTWRSHQVPFAEMASKPEHIKLLEAWMKSYKPEELFDANGTLPPELAELAPTGNRRMGANPHANGGTCSEDLRCPNSGLCRGGSASRERSSLKPRGYWEVFCATS